MTDPTKEEPTSSEIEVPALSWSPEDEWDPAEDFDDFDPMEKYDLPLEYGELPVAEKSGQPVAELGAGENTTSEGKTTRASAGINPTLAMLAVVGVEYFLDLKKNAIGWCCQTLNFFRGCSPVSEACKNCYAMAEGGRQILMNALSPYNGVVEFVKGAWRWNGRVEPTGLHVWLRPFGTNLRGLAFADSMSDLFHENLREDAILFALRTMWRARNYVWQVLTKRAPRMANIMSRLHLVDDELQLAAEPLPPEQRFVIPNLWLGVTAENQARADERLPFLAATLAVVRFVSIEPLLGPFDLSNHAGAFEWVIVGGESGEHFRPMKLEWPEAVRDFCVKNHVAFFFKQLAAKNPQFLPKTLHGVSWRKFPRTTLLPVLSRPERVACRKWVTAEYGRVFPVIPVLGALPEKSPTPVSIPGTQPTPP